MNLSRLIRTISTICKPTINSPFAKLYLDACLSHLEDKPPLMLNRINIMCNYVSDHIGVKTAEDLFERAYKRVKNIKHNDSDVLKELFSFLYS